MLTDIDDNLYHKIFPRDPHLFLSRKFIELNKAKVEKIFRLVQDGQYSPIGLILGMKNGCLCSPFSAPFGGFHFTHDLIYTNVIDDFIKNLKEFVVENQFRCITITLPPNIYNQTFDSKVINGLFNNGFKIECLDISNWVCLDSYSNNFREKSSRHHLTQANRNGLVFKIINEDQEKELAYNIIRDNRLRLGRPIYMKFTDLKDMEEICNIDYYGTYDPANNLIAASINYRSNKYIVNGVFWGDTEEGRKLRAMDFCIYNLLNKYKSEGFKYFDIGISTENGRPNEGLVRFKEAHEGTSSLRYTFYWKNNSL